MLYVILLFFSNSPKYFFYITIWTAVASQMNVLRKLELCLYLLQDLKLFWHLFQFHFMAVLFLT